MQIVLKQNEIHQAIAEYVSAKTQFKVKDSDVRIKEEYAGGYNEQEIVGFHAEIEIE